MKKRNKYLSLVCVVMCLLFSLVFFVRAEAASNVNVQVVAPSELPAVGQTFQVTVDISGNPGFCAAQFTLSYDKNVVTCTQVELGELLDGMLSVVNAEAEEGAIVAAASSDPATGDGTLGTFTFQVLKQGDPAFRISKAILSGENGETFLEIKETGSNQGDSTKKTEGSKEAADTSLDTTTDTPTDTTMDPAEETKTEEKATGTETPVAETGKTTVFSDVPNDFWAAGDIARAVEKKLVSGYEDGTFRPSQNVTRAEFVTMLWRLEGSPAAAGEAGFSDVPSDAWYAPQVSWAAEKGIVNGKSPTEFDPNGAVTRQEAMTILFRYNGGQSGGELMLTEIYDAQFRDSGSIAEWAKPAMYWAVYKGLVTGVTADTLVPDGNATRAQIAVILVRYADAFNK